MTNIRGDIDMLVKLKSSNQNPKKMLNIFFMVDGIFTGISKTLEDNNEGKLDIFEGKSGKVKKESDEQPDTTDMPELGEESAAERRNQQGKGLKILTPDQMLSRLPFNLVQLKAGNNSQKLINETRQLLYSLYHSKKLTKEIYNHLINAI